MQTLSEADFHTAAMWILTHPTLAKYCKGKELAFCIDYDTGVRMGPRTAVNLRKRVLEEKNETVH